jgi:hypothetical protein
MQQCTQHGGIDAAGQAEQHAIVPDLFADARDRVGDDVACIPARLAAADLAHEALEHLHALERVRHLRMKLYGVEMSGFIGHRRERHGARECDGDEARRQLIDTIAVAHPHVERRSALLVRVIAEAIEQAAGCGCRNARVAEFAMCAGGDAAAQLLRHRLHAIADAEHGHTELVHRLRRDRRRFVRHGLGTARENDAARTECTHVGIAHVPGMDLAVDAAFADAPGDELRVLRAEVQNQNSMRMDVGRVQKRGGNGSSGGLGVQAKTSRGLVHR